MTVLLKTRARPNSVWPTLLHAAFYLLLLSTGFVGSAKAGVPQNRPELSISRAPQLAIADFDSDGQPDLASVEFGQSGPQNYAINFRLTSGTSQSIDIRAPEGGLQLKARDINGDSFPDVVVTTFWTDRPVVVLLNDGRGNFTRSAPAGFPGAFATPETSLASGDGNKADAVAALLSRYFSEPWEERVAASSPLNVVGRAVVGRLDFVSSANCNSSFGRAPPCGAVHS
jgi:hypothetical protein